MQTLWSTLYEMHFLAYLLIPVAWLTFCLFLWMMGDLMCEKSELWEAIQKEKSHDV
jgi:hypothetical protein